MGNKAPAPGSPPDQQADQQLTNNDNTLEDDDKQSKERSLQLNHQEPSDSESMSEHKTETENSHEGEKEQESSQQLLEVDYEPLEDSQSEVDTSDESVSEVCESEVVYKSSPVCYKLSLCCTTDESLSSNKRLVLPQAPHNIRQLKKSIEKQYSIPTACQTISFEGQELRDNQTIEELYIRDEDRLVVGYPSTGNVEEVGEIIASMVTMTKSLKRKHITRIIQSGKARGNAELANVIDDNKVDLLPSLYFLSIAGERNKANSNRLYFVTNNGLEAMHQLHTQLLNYQWERMSVGLMKLEQTILRTLWNLSAAFNIRMLLFERPTLEAVMRSLERAVIPAYTFIESPGEQIADPVLRHSVTICTCETLYKAIGTIGNLAEIPSCRESIASRESVLNQLLGCLTCPSYNKIASIVSSAGLLCLAYSPETHQYLTTDKVITKFGKAINRRDAPTGDGLLLRYFSCLFFAQLLYHSKERISGRSQLLMLAAMSSFFSEVDHNRIRECEVKDGYVWSTVAPLVKLAYLPWQSPQRNLSLPLEGLGDNTKRTCAQVLDDLCIEAGVFSLQNMLLSPDTREILIEEGLVDYIVCLPWHVKPRSKASDRARELRGFLGTKLQLQPPSLLNTAKAKLAVSHCGLETVLEARSLHDIVQNIASQ